jgi:hypothetical protein
MDFQYVEKGRDTQRRRQLHIIPLNLPEVDFQMPNISIEKISTFFGNTSKDVKQHLFKFKITCDVFNLTEKKITCRLFLQNMQGNALEWFYSLLPGTITTWDMLETSFSKTFIPNVINVVAHPPYPIWTQNNEVNDLEEKSNERMGIFSSIYIVENENENSNLQDHDFSLSYTPYEEILNRKIKSEIEEPPPNEKEDSSQHTHMKDIVTYDEKSQEHWQQEPLVKEINLENNDGQDFHSMKE